MKKHHGFSIDELENMMPFERDVYRVLLQQWIESEERKNENK